MRIVIIGGTGLISSKLVVKLREQGHQAVPAAPDTGVNTLTGEGLTDAIAGADMVVDVSNSPSFEDAAVLDFFRTSTGNILAFADPKARYYGATLEERSLVPGEGARVGDMTLDEYVKQKAAAAPVAASR